tara:strand:- start:3764 stop:5131 length:1368 start_codon:yes stop_codon:yes gene_type:complete
MVYKLRFVLNYKIPLLSLFFISIFSHSQNTFVPDDNFEQVLIDLGFDVAPLDDFVPTANINTIVNLDIPPNKNIVDLTGIAAFSALQKLDCRNNAISILNVSQLGNLQILWCSSNQLTNLNVTQNSNLISLLCDDNLLTNLNTTNNPNLNILVCGNNQITNLNVSNNTNLSRLECNNNLLENLNIYNNTNLSFLNGSNNQITGLDTSNNNRLSTLNVAFNQLSKLDVSSNSNLVSLNCSNNMLCFLNIKNVNNANITFMDFSSNSALYCVVVDNVTGNHSTWQPASFTNYVASETDCDNFVNVDKLNNVVTKDAYTLPNLVNGNYFTEPKGNGLQLNAGAIITTSQTLYIYAETACNSNETSFSILINNEAYFIPKFFTPNNDGNHDVWQVIDNTNTIESIAIYDRYGKLLKFLLPNSLGWNGIFNGKLLNTDDYWYVIMLNSGDTLKGHFTLKR